ncbi:Fic family protein [Companilactobacillus mishanensis]|uniref:Fic family protein n=1 Tax=Companilactobacillus mishanensis TaxID=2486008 RepID=A0A5P0ZI05_9LACO|nr:Fic family protein [Companilactobacillus mishanensis]MQS52642.1 Fic family protein [Companilactobacillus mishanensis]
MPDGEKQVQDFYEQRFNNEVAVKLGLKIKPIKRGERIKDEYEMFYLPVVNISILKEIINTNSRKIISLLGKLPEVAKGQIFFNNLIDEIQSTNDIEGVRSTRKELSEVIESVFSKDNKSLRFKGLVEQYNNFRISEYNEITDISEFRKIYDTLVSDEVSKSDIPDGQMFRKNPVEIRDGYKVIHSGSPSENSIKSDLSELVNLMNDEEIPALEKCFAAHYFYEYVHPFYDGNGRTGRFIVCSYLSRKLDYMSAINLSTAIMDNKTMYYHAFSEMSDPHNKSDATTFIMTMMKILVSGQNAIIDKLNESITLIEQIDKLIEDLKLTKIQKSIMSVLFQKRCFGNFLEALTDLELMKILGISRYKLNKEFEQMEDDGLVQIVIENPKTHKVSDNLVDQLYGHN